VEWLKVKALSSSPSTARKKEKIERKKERKKAKEKIYIRRKLKAKDLVAHACGSQLSGG
jgi:hypothetical protein